MSGSSLSLSRADAQVDDTVKTIWARMHVIDSRVAACIFGSGKIIVAQDGGRRLVKLSVDHDIPDAHLSEKHFSTQG